MLKNLLNVIVNFNRNYVIYFSFITSETYLLIQRKEFFFYLIKQQKGIDFATHTNSSIRAFLNENKKTVMKLLHNKYEEEKKKRGSDPLKIY